MTKPEWQEFAKATAEIKPIPGFDSLKWLRKVRAQIYEETKNMTPEQIRERERQAVERDKRRRARQVKLVESGDSEIRIIAPEN